jgi:hypothetical protein
VLARAGIAAGHGWDRAGSAGVLVNMSVWEYAFTLKEHYPPPGVTSSRPVRSANIAPTLMS